MEYSWVKAVTISVRLQIPFVMLPNINRQRGRWNRPRIELRPSLAEESKGEGGGRERTCWLFQQKRRAGRREEDRIKGKDEHVDFDKINKFN